MKQNESDGTLTCREVSACLSDLLDIHHGETPGPEASVLCAPAYLAAVEAHLPECVACRAEFEHLKEIGQVFAHFPSSESSAPNFDGYAALVRERVKGGQWTPAVRKGPDVDGLARRRFSRPWIPMAAASAAAVLAAFSISFLVNRMLRNDALEKLALARPAKPSPVEPPEVPYAGAYSNQADPLRLPYRPLTVVPGPTGVDILPVGPNATRRSMRIDSSAKESLQSLESELEKNEAMIFTENRAQQRALLGLNLVVKAAKRPTGDSPEGLAVCDVLSSSPAARAGLRPGDYIMALNDVAFNSSNLSEVLKLLKALQDLGQGEVIHIDYARKQDNDWVIRKGVTVLGEYEK